MRRKNSIYTFFGIAFFTIGILIFIHFSNDHVECENVIENFVGKNGEDISIEKHVCKEKFNI